VGVVGPCVERRADGDDLPQSRREQLAQFAGIQATQAPADQRRALVVPVEQCADLLLEGLQPVVELALRPGVVALAPGR
jgi:hypothetical protein